MSCPQARADELTEAIVDMIALDLRPVSTVNGLSSLDVQSGTCLPCVFRNKHLITAAEKACGGLSTREREAARKCSTFRLVID